MRRSVLLAMLGVSVACGAVQACGGSDGTPALEGDAGETGTIDHDASSARSDATTGGDDAAQGADANTQDDATLEAGDDGGSDAANDDASDAGNVEDASDAADAPDVVVTCTGTDTPCAMAGGESGLCKGGVCSPCVDPSDDGACTAAYALDGGPSSFLCASGQCVAGDCRTSATCAGELCTNNHCTGCSSDVQCAGDGTYGSGTMCTEDGGTCVPVTCSNANAACPSSPSHFCCDGAASSGDAGVDGSTVLSCVLGDCCTNAECGGNTPVCAGHTCTACDAHSGLTWVVDPVHGSDAQPGSGTAGGTSSGLCAFKTITKAIAAVDAAAALADGGAGTPPAGTKIVVLGPATASAATGETFPLVIPENVTIEGSGGGVALSNAAGVTISASKPGIALRDLAVDGTVTSTVCVDVSGGATTIEGVAIHRCGVGVRAGGTATLTVGPGAHVYENVTGLRVQNGATANVTSLSTQILVAGNTGTGIVVADKAKLDMTGDPNGNSTVMIRENAVGIVFQQSPGNGNLPTSTLDGIVAKGNTAAGLQVYGGSSLKLRNAALVGNLYGALVTQGVVSGYENDTSNVDLGSDASADAGANVGGNILQTKSAANGGVPNTGAGLCVLVQPNKSQTLRAKGNKFSSADHATEVDCATSAVDIGSQASCTGGANVAGQGLNGNNVLVDGCTF